MAVDAALHANAQPFVDAGFTPIEDIVEPRRDVRRLLLHDPYYILGMLGIEIERFGDGRSVLRMQYYTYRGPTQPLPAETWDALAQLEPRAFPLPAAPASPKPTTVANTPSPPPPICHGWHSQFLSGTGRTGGWTECYGGKADDAAYQYTVILLRAALATEPSCPIDDTNLFWSYHKCFGAKNTLDDPELNAQYAALVKIYANEGGADLLGAARLAVQAPGIAVGNAAWKQAREAVAQLKVFEDNEEDALRKLQALAFKAYNASDGDQFQIRTMIRTWSEFQAAQRSNYADVVSRLVWAGESIPQG